MKYEKPSSVHVLDRNFYLRRRSMLSFTFTDSYDLRKACGYSCWALNTIRNVFHKSQWKASYSMKYNFLGFKSGLSQLCLWRVYQISKITICSRFGWWSTIIRGFMWCFNLFLGMTMISKKLRRTHVGVADVIRIISHTLKFKQMMIFEIWHTLQR